MDAVELTQALVRFASPSHTCNRPVAEYLAELLRALAFTVELTTYRDELGVEKVNVVARKGEGDAGPGLAYCCHSDVVPAESWTGPGGAFDPVVEQDRLYGRGSCDMKGSAACMLAAMTVLGHTPLSAPVYFVCTADEEVAYLGARALVQDSDLYREMVQRQPHVLIGEPTELGVVYAHKGICTMRFVSHGEAAHSATRHGRNANLAMIPFLQDLKRVYDETESLEKWQNEEFEPPTMSWNIGLNDHNSAVNVKAAQSVCTVFYRPLPGVEDSPLRDRCRALAEDHGLTYSESHCGPVYTDPHSAFVREMLDLAGGDARTVAYGTDAGEFTELHHKVVCGPGSIAQAHTSDEWVELAQLTAGTELYRQCVLRWCSANLQPQGSDR